MTLDEAIKHAEEVAEEKENEGKLLCQSEGASIGCLTCAEEHRQLAEWLRDYKRLKEQQPCEDAVNRQAVCEFLENHAKTYDDVRVRIGLKAGSSLVANPDNVPSVTPALKKERWIPVSERLPEERDWYLGIFKEPDIGWINPIPFICDYLLGTKTKATTKEGWILKGHTDREEYIDYYFNLECVAWMPLPEPYSRQAVIDAIGKTSDELYENIKKGATFPQRQWFDGMAQAQSILENLPSAQPERKKGRWIPVDSYSAFGGDEATWIAHGNPVAFYYCSECKEEAYAGEDGEPLLTDYCPNCGADMRGEQDG